MMNLKTIKGYLQTAEATVFKGLIQERVTGGQQFAMQTVKVQNTGPAQKFSN